MSKGPPPRSFGAEVARRVEWDRYFDELRERRAVAAAKAKARVAADRERARERAELARPRPAPPPATWSATVAVLVELARELGPSPGAAVVLPVAVVDGDTTERCAIVTSTRVVESQDSPAIDVIVWHDAAAAYRRRYRLGRDWRAFDGVVLDGDAARETMIAFIRRRWKY